ncbi:hypothetical protein Plhal304r1_c009g0037821 [Plasmopara halstedii]
MTATNSSSHHIGTTRCIPINLDPVRTDAIQNTHSKTKSIDYSIFLNTGTAVTCVLRKSSDGSWMMDKFSATTIQAKFH